jgi:glycosyltransferase involved in cell wall biosynthesis
MKILYVTDQLFLHGGIEKMLSQKINYWIAYYGYEVVLCTSEQRNHDFVYELDKKVKNIDLGINYYRNKSYFHPKNLLKSFLHFDALKKLIKKEKPDFIVSVNYTPEQFFLPFIEKQIPKIKEFHSSGVTLMEPITIFDKLKHQLFLLFGRYQVQVVLNEDEKKYYPFQHLHIIPNFIEINESAQPLQRENTIIAAGRIASVKQFDHLIKVWSHIGADFPEWQIKIFGNGDEQLSLQLRELIEKLEVPNIHLMGATSHLDHEMQKASVYAMTSATECFPMVLLEAQAAGMTVISYNCPHGPQNIITNNQDGILVPHNETAVFAQNLSALLKNESRRQEIGRMAKQKVKEFSKDKIMKQWNDLFLKLRTIEDD